jgi:hypothetical protein
MPRGRKPKYATQEEKKAARRNYRKYNEEERKARWDALTAKKKEECMIKMRNFQDKYKRLLNKIATTGACAREKKTYEYRKKTWTC